MKHFIPLFIHNYRNKTHPSYAIAVKKDENDAFFIEENIQVGNLPLLGNDVILSTTMTQRFIEQFKKGKIAFCTQPDKNGNFYLVDIDVENQKYQRGYCYRYACRKDNVVGSKRQLQKIADWAATIGFQRD